MACALAVAACGSSNTHDGGCPTPLCNGVCCGAGTICVLQAGKLSCATTCSDPGACSTTDPCCTPLGDGDGGLMQNGVCFPEPSTSNAYDCICISGSQCPTGCCAPHVDTAGDPVGPLVCKPLDGNSYNCCTAASGVAPCTVATDCCFGDPAGNYYCSAPCAHTSMCGNARCLTFSDTSLTTCPGKMGCGPP